MKEYVLCYAESLDNPDAYWTIFVERKSPSWQAGRLSFPGGVIEPGETPVQAAVRELKEEVGLDAEPTMCRVRGVIYGESQIIHVVLCPFKGPIKSSFNGPERLLVLGLHQALEPGSCILNELRTILPLCITREPWRMIAGGDRHPFSYVLQVGER